MPGDVPGGSEKRKNMARTTEIKQVNIGRLIPYINNAKQHSEDQVTRIASSIREFGFLNPVLIDHDYNIIAGHGRVMAAQKLDMTEVPCVFVEGLSDAQRKAYILADNRLGEMADWDMDLVTSELELLQEMDFSIDITGFELKGTADDWFKNRERDDDSKEEDNDEYNEFIEKFEIKKTTDDCYTPDGVYDAVADWVTEKYGYKREQMIRPFYPGGDYQNEKYPEGCCVVDNPPFSILSEIRAWYKERGIKYFLFAPMASCIGGGKKVHDCAVTIGATVIYENKAVVPTSFVTNLEPDYLIITEPRLRAAVQEAADKYAERFKNPMPKYSYPSCVLTAAMGAYMSKYGQEFKLKKESAYLIRELDMQKEQGKAIYGGGYLLSEKAAAEKAAAEKAAAEKAAATVWLLSDREKEIQSELE
jgi:hypothetical protein